MKLILFFLVIFVPNILLCSSKGTLESLILTWEISKKGCESDVNTSEKLLHCKTMEQIALGLEDKGFCLGANQLKIYELYYDPKFKDQYDIFEGIVKNKWIPCIYDFLIEDISKSVKFDQDKNNDIKWLYSNINGTYDIDVNKIIYRELVVDQMCRGSTEPESTYAGCAVREEITQIMEDYGICRGDHNNPPHLNDVGGPIVWIFRHKWIPCLYSDLTGESLVRVNDQSAFNLENLVNKNGLLFEVDTLYPFTGFVIDTEKNSSGWIVKGQKSGLWHFFDDNNELIKSEHYEKGSLVKETNLIMYEMFEAAKLNFPDQCEWESNQGRFHSFSFKKAEFYAIACLSGTYNYTFVYLERKSDGTYKPLSFSYPVFDYEYTEDGDIKNSKLVGMKSEVMLCNPTYNQDQLTISTKCKGRGIGDVASYGLWQLIQSEDAWGIHNQFMLLSFKDDLTSDGKINPVEMINFSNSQGILKAVAISITALNAHVIDNLKCIHPFTSIPTIMALEANDLIGSDTMSIKDGIISFEIKGDWNLGSLPVKGMRLRFTDNLHQELLPDLFDPDTTGTLPPERYEFILEATVEEVTNWYEQTLEIEYIKPSEQTIDDVVRPIYIFDHTEYYKNKWPEVKAITSLACTPIY